MIPREPATYEKAVNSSNSTKWSEAMESEMRSLNDNEVWDVVPLPIGRQVVASKCVYEIKRDADGNAERHKKQDSVTLFTAERRSKAIALSSAAQESVWLRKLTTELGQVLSHPTTVYEDNQSAISMCKNPQYHGRAKHIEIRHHYI